MRDCKNIAIRFKEEEELYKQFIKAKTDYDKDRRERGERETSCIEFAKILLHRALKEEEKEREEEGEKK